MSGTVHNTNKDKVGDSNNTKIKEKEQMELHL